MTSEHDLTEHLLDYYLAHGMKHIARRFRLKADIIIEILTEAGIHPEFVKPPPVFKRGYGRYPKPKNTVPRGANSLSGFTRLTDEQKAKLRAEYVPGKMLENKRLAEKYNTSSAWVSQLTADLRG